MAILPIGLRASEKSTVSASYPNNSLLNQIYQLIKDFEANSVSIEDVKIAANQHIEELNKIQEKDLSLAREGLCVLLKLNIEDIQLKVISCLKPLLQLTFLADDIKQNRSQMFLFLESKISESIAIHLRSNTISLELVTFLIDLYQDILDRLWVLPHLTEDRSSYALIVEENGPRIVGCTDLWLKNFPKEGVRNNKLKALLKNLQKMMKMIVSCPSKTAKKMTQLRLNLNSMLFLTSLGEIFQEIGNIHRAVDYYQEDLSLLIRVKINIPGEQETVEAMRSKVLNHLGLAHSDLGEHRKALEYLEKALPIAQELRDRGEEARAYAGFGIANYSLGGYRKAIEYGEKALQIAQELGDREKEASVYGNLGLAYDSLGEYRKAIEHHEKALQIVQELGDREKEGRVYGDLGNEYGSLGKRRKALECNNKALQIAQELGDRKGEGLALGNLGNEYGSLGEYNKAIEFLQKSLEVAQELDDRGEEGKVYGDLGHKYGSLGESNKAIEHYEKSLQIAQELGDRGDEGRAYGGLGNEYGSLGDHRKAIGYLEKSLQIAQELGDRGDEGRTYGDLGSEYTTLGEYRKAIEHHEKALQIAQELGDRAEEGRAYGNIGTAYKLFGEYRKAIEYHEKDLQISQELSDRGGEGFALGNLGHAYRSLGEFRKAIEYYEKRLQIEQELGNKGGEGRTYGSLGNAYFSLGEFRKAIEYYEKYLLSAQELGDREGAGTVFNNLGHAYENLGDLSKAEENFRQGITTYSMLQKELGDHSQWKIAFFEEQARTYMGLERVLLKQQKGIEALEVSDFRRSRALASILREKLSHQGVQLSEQLKFSEIQALAHKLQTTFVLYSLFPSLAPPGATTLGKLTAIVYVISSKGLIVSRELSLEALSEEMKNIDKVLEKFPHARSASEAGESVIPLELQTRDGGPSTISPAVIKRFTERLKKWYEFFIAPIKKDLPLDSQYLTIIPDDFLSQIPFAALRDPETGQYLIERHSICIAPSIKVVEILDRLPKELASLSCIIGNPTTSNPADQLLLGQKEAEFVSSYVKASEIHLAEAATVHQVMESMKKAHWVHFACHGEANEKLDPHSVFQGCLKLAPDSLYPKGHLYAQQISSLSLKAELVFMSACFSGSGKIQKEGSIGQIWSFHVAQVPSVIGALWRVPESELTLELVRTFYKHVLGIETRKLSRAEALRQAMLMAIEKEKENPHLWGSFFLSGLS